MSDWRDAIQLTKRERQVLAALSEGGARIVKNIAPEVDWFDGSGRQHSGAVRSWLVNFEKFGLVKRLDSERPVAWLRTAAGTRVLERVMTPAPAHSEPPTQESRDLTEGRS